MSDNDSISSDEFTPAERTIYERRAALGYPRMTDVEMMNQSSDSKLLMAIDGCVFDVTAFLDEHPGGKLILQRNAGTDVTEMFNRMGHSDAARETLAKMFVADYEETEEGQEMMEAKKRKKLPPPAEPPKVTAKKLLPPL